MSATDEELRWANGRGVDHITWGLIDFSIAFALFFWFNVLLELYTTSGGRYGCRDVPSSNSAASRSERGESSNNRQGAWYSRLSVGGNADHSAGSMQLNPLSSNNRGDASPSGSGSSSDRTAINGAARKQHNSRRAEDEYSEDEQTHVLFDDEEGDEDAKSIHDADPFDDRRH